MLGRVAGGTTILFVARACEDNFSNPSDLQMEPEAQQDVSSDSLQQKHC